MSKNKDGDAYLLLAAAKRVTVRKYKGSVLIDIREVRLSFLCWDWYDMI